MERRQIPNHTLFPETTTSPLPVMPPLKLAEAMESYASMHTSWMFAIYMRDAAATIRNLVHQLGHRK
jgi:hypothetical protein